jgi:hypothetical protein
MTKIITIGDLHGRNVWKTFADIPLLLKADEDTAGYGTFEPDYDFYVFLGDYTDAFDKTNKEIRDNLNDVLRFKKLYPKNVILLWGNHEMFYLLDSPWNYHGYNYDCSGNRPVMHFDLHELFNKNFDMFQLAFQYDNYLWTHAGVHKGWYKIFEKEFEELDKNLRENLDIHYEYANLADKLNKAFIHRLKCLFHVGRLRGGTAKVGGPLWLDKRLGFKKPLTGYHQIVGHTATNDIQKYKINDDTSIIYIDVLHKHKSYYVVNL